MAYSTVILPPGFGDGSSAGGGGGNDFTKPILEILGSVTGPSYSFAENQNSGLYATANTVGLAVNGLPGLTLASDGRATFLKGAALGGPLLLQQQAGIYNGNAINPNGVQVARVGSLYLSANGGPGTTVFYKQTGNDDQGWTPVADAVVGSGGAPPPAAPSYPLRAPTGSAAAPTYAFEAASADTGVYSPSAHALGFATSGLLRLTIDADGNVSVGTFYASSLDVAGGARLRGTSNFDGSAIFNAAANFKASATFEQGASFPKGISVGQTASLAALQASGASTLQGAVTLGASLAVLGGALILGGTDPNPNGQISAPLGSLYLATVAAAGVSSLWVKSDASANQGWSPAATGNQLPWPLTAPDGAVDSPSYGFGSSSAGLYSPAAGVLAFSTAGQDALRVEANGNTTVANALSVGSDLNASGAGFFAGLTSSAGGRFTGNIAVLFEGPTRHQGAALFTAGLSANSDASFSGGFTLQDGAIVLNGDLADPNGSVGALPGSLYLSKSSVVAFLLRLTKDRRQIWLYRICLICLGLIGLASVLLPTAGWPLGAGHYWASSSDESTCATQV